MVWSNLDIFLVLSRDQETLRLIDAFHYLCVIIYNYAIKYNCSKKRPSPPSCTFYSEPKNLKKFWLVNFLPRIVLDVLVIKLQYILHPNLDLVNKPVRPLLFTKSRYLLNRGGAYIVKYEEGSWSLFTKSRYSLNRDGAYSKICMKGAGFCLLNRGIY